MKYTSILFALAVGLTLTACDRHKTEDAKQEAKDAAHSAKEAAKDAADAAKDAAKDARDNVKEEAGPTKLKFKGAWNEVKGRLKQKYAQLTDDDLLYAEGKEEELIGRLEKKLGKSREEVIKILEED